MNKLGSPQMTIGWWFKFFTNWQIMAILFTTLGLFAINMWIIQLLSANKFQAWTWAMTIPAFLLTFLLSYIILGEGITPNQYIGLALLIISMIIVASENYII